MRSYQGFTLSSIINSCSGDNSIVKYIEMPLKWNKRFILKCFLNLVNLIFFFKSF